MTLYIWVAVLGVGGFFALLSFFYFWLKSSKLRKELGISKWSILPELLMLGLSGGSVTLTVMFLLRIKEQLVQLTN